MAPARGCGASRPPKGNEGNAELGVEVEAEERQVWPQPDSASDTRAPRPQEAQTDSTRAAVPGSDHTVPGPAPCPWAPGGQAHAPRSSQCPRELRPSQQKGAVGRGQGRGISCPHRKEGRSTPKPPPPLPGVGLGTEAGGSSLPSGKCLSQEGPRHSRKVRTMCRPEGKAREKPLEPTPQPTEARPAQAPGSGPALEAAPQREREVALALLAHPPAHLPPPAPSLRSDWSGRARPLLLPGCI